MQPSQTPTIQTDTGLNLSTLHEQSTATLKEQLAKSVQITANYLTYIAAIWQELERRGEDMSSLRHGLMHYIPMIANRTLDARAVVNYAGQKTLLSTLAAMPIEQQRALIDTGSVDIVELDSDGHQVIKPTRLETLTAAQTFQAFGKGRLLTTDEQYQVLLVRQTAKPKTKTKTGKPYRMTSNLKIDDDALVIGKQGVSIQKLIQFLRDNKLI